MKAVLLIQALTQFLKAFMGIFRRDPKVKEAAEKAKKGDLSAINDRYPRGPAGE